ncbi:MAG: OmpA family protein [Gammaproteobacteria bacterium]|nr:OmpA family protein [Gammaproteobacteria bacterium]MDP6617569.1 OmpA family protein [Gammaproteobacteria bacterium]MDP6694446.1 OmpA family protein [Gammaproteobacteria bacterium]MDP7041446.1 OmpA family protein [Gammaproteobacteria bacterium]
MKKQPYFKYAACLILTLFVVACTTTTDPYTGEQKTSRSSRGAAVGAAIGAAIGLITGDDSAERKRRALKLAGIGAIAGVAVGSYQDRQEAELRQRLGGSGVSVTRIGDNITLNMPGNITFGVDEASINTNFYDVLDSVAIVLNEFESTFVEVAGHTDSTGSEQYNLGLSQSRAASVVTYLGRQQVRTDRMISVGAGESLPVASNATPAGRQQNRRVEITIVPITA